MTIFDQLFEELQRYPGRHARGDPWWQQWDAKIKPAVAAAFGQGGPATFGPFGELAIPYTKMGAIDSLDLFGLDELILFGFYRTNRNAYRKVVDFGANIGLHTIILAKCGFNVRSFEPDALHLRLLEENLSRNRVSSDVHAAAVSVVAGETEFVRVLGNTTGSHIRGAKSNVYGEMETIKVPMEAALPHLEWADLAKIDIEGHEAELLTNLPHDVWEKTDAVLEVGSARNAEAIYDYFVSTRGSPAGLFAQKIGWSKVSRLEDMPMSHRDGSLFLSSKPAMPWV